MADSSSLITPIVFEDKEYLVVVDLFSKVFGMLLSNVLKGIFEKSRNYKLTISLAKSEFQAEIIRNVMVLSKIRDGMHTILNDEKKVSYAICKVVSVEIADAHTLFSLAHMIKAPLKFDEIAINLNILNFDQIGVKVPVFSGHSGSWSQLRLDVVHRWDASYITYPNGARYKVSIIVTTEAIKKLVVPHDVMWCSVTGFIPFIHVSDVDNPGIQITKRVLKANKKECTIALKEMIMTEMSSCSFFKYET